MTNNFLSCPVRRPRADDDGYTLTEFIVAMGIFTIFLAVFGSGVVLMTRDTVRTQATIDTDNEGRRAYSALDKQVRNAAAINEPVSNGTGWYVEFRTDVAETGVRVPPLCTQWRLDTTTDRLQVRTWNEGGTPTGWTTRAQGVTNPLADKPFALVKTGSTSTRQQLKIDWQMDAGPNAADQRVQGTLVARNTTASTSTNVSGNRICTDQGQP